MSLISEQDRWPYPWESRFRWWELVLQIPRTKIQGPNQMTFMNSPWGNLKDRHLQTGYQNLLQDEAVSFPLHVNVRHMRSRRPTGKHFPCLKSWWGLEQGDDNHSRLSNSTPQIPLLEDTWALPVWSTPDIKVTGKKTRKVYALRCDFEGGGEKKGHLEQEAEDSKSMKGLTVKQSKRRIGIMSTLTQSKRLPLLWNIVSVKPRLTIYLVSVFGQSWFRRQEFGKQVVWMILSE